MASQSFYRKWRSQTFEDVVGQPHVTRTLRNAMQMGRVAHAYLFCGPRGVGKTSVARILAKAVNCNERKDGEPCNECAMCRAITQGRALDVIEVDAASNRRIEEMRDLREKVNFAPNEANYKVYILDEAHMLTNEASNALLKTLEEPPAHTVFVLVTTEAHKIPETIISRCQRFDFRRISSREIVTRLNLVCSREGLSVAPEALALVARTATGSLRDAEGLLDQLVAYCGQEVTEAQARDILGLSGDEAVRRLAEHVIGSDLAAGLELVNEVVDAGTDLRRFAEDFVAYLRGVLLLKGRADGAALRDVSGDTLEAMRSCAERVSLEHLVHLIRVFGEAEQGTRGGAAPQLALELAVAEAVLYLERGSRPAARSAPEHPLPSPTPTRRAQEQIKQAGPVPAPARRVARPEAPPAPTVEHAPEGPNRGTATPEGGDARSQEESQPARHVERAAPGDLAAILEILRRRWKEDIVDPIGPVNKPLQALLRSCDPYEVGGGAIIIGCDAQFHRDKLGEVQNRRVLEKAMIEVLGTLVPLQFEVVPRSKRGQPPPATSDPLVKEVLSWGGRIRAVVSEPGDKPSAEGAAQPGEPDEEVKDES